MTGHFTTSSYVSSDNQNTGTDVDGMLTVAQPGLYPRDGQLWHGFAGSQPQLNAVSRQHDEMMGLMGVYREQQVGLGLRSSNYAPAHTISQRGPTSYKRCGSIPSAEDEGMEQPISKHRRLHSPQQLHNLQPSYSQPPLPPHPDPLTIAGPNTSVLHQNVGNRGLAPGHPNTQQTPLSQVLGRPPPHHLYQNDQRMNPPPLPDPIPTFCQFRYQMGRTVAYPYLNPCTFSMGMSIGPSARRLPPGLPRPVMAYQHPMYPPIRPRVCPRAPPQMNPQVPPQTQIGNPTAAEQSAPSGPPPPYPGPDAVPEKPKPEATRATPPTSRRRASRASGTSVVLGLNLDYGPEDGGTGLHDTPVLRRETTGRGPTRANPPRKARPTNLTELGLDSYS